MNFTIIGGGVNGLCSAYYLQKEGHQVNIIDPAFSSAGTSYGNAGMVVPSHFIPMASPGVIGKGIKWMFNSSSPFYIKPRLDLNLLSWLFKFYNSCNVRNVQQNQELIWNYNEMSKALYREISLTEDFNFDYHERGLMMLYKNEKSKKEEVEIGERAQKLGLKVQYLDKIGVQDLNPGTPVEVLGGVYYPGDSHLYSNLFMEEMKALLKKRGVNLISKTVHTIEQSEGKVSSLQCKDGSQYDVENLIISGGVWTKKLLSTLGIRLALEDGKGYSITTFNTKEKPDIPSILTDEKVAITPMGNDLRITGTLEISGISMKMNHKRVQGFLSAVPKYFPNIKTAFPDDEKDIWVGYRPLSPNGVPYVGRIEKIPNLIVATGHGMMGMSLGPATGKIVANIASGKSTALDLEKMRIER